jgi:DivIVA domain-containing protein
VELDRQAIERRDFPIARRGYDPAAVDAHLSLLARHIDERSQAEAGAPEPSLAATASSQVQGIIRAAENAASEIERDATQYAKAVREEADRDARSSREQAIQQARSHVAAVAEASKALLERVGAMDGEVSALLEGLRAGAHRLAGDLATADANMGELYDAAAGRTAAADQDDRVAGVSSREPASGAPVEDPSVQKPSAPAAAPPEAKAEPPLPPPPSSEAPAAASEPGKGAERGGDLDGARLVALNMALNGESREDTERYLAEHFQLVERRRLVDEVYAAIET